MGTTNNKIVNVAPGTDDTDAVNVKQLKAAKTEVKLVRMLPLSTQQMELIIIISIL